MLKNLIVTLVALVISIVALEAGSAIVLESFGQNLNTVADEFVFEQVNEDGTFSPNEDYVMPVRKNASFVWTRPEFAVQVDTNSKGYREDFEFEMSDVSVGFFGDSFTFGHGVELQERFTNIAAQQLDELFDGKIVSFSYPNGFQPEHYEFFFRNHPDIKADFIVVGVYLGNDFGADVSETEYDRAANRLTLPYRRLVAAGQPAINPTSYIFPLNAMYENSYTIRLVIKIMGKTAARRHLFKDGFEGPNSPNSTEMEFGDVDLLQNRAVIALQNLQRDVEDRGGKMIVLIIPQNFYSDDVAGPHIRPQLLGRISELKQGKNLLTATMDMCAQTGLECIDTSTLLTAGDFFPRDAHWSPSGHQKIGEFIGAYIADKVTGSR